MYVLQASYIPLVYALTYGMHLKISVKRNHGSAVCYFFPCISAPVLMTVDVHLNFNEVTSLGDSLQLIQVAYLGQYNCKPDNTVSSKHSYQLLIAATRIMLGKPAISRNCDKNRYRIWIREISGSGLRWCWSQNILTYKWTCCSQQDLIHFICCRLCPCSFCHQHSNIL